MSFKIELGEDNSILRKECEIIKKHEIQKYGKLGKQMIKYIKNPKNQGIGLAWPQIGIDKQIFVAGIPRNREDGNYQVICMINPEILSYSEEQDLYEEGCLSLPGTTGTVQRPISVEVKYLDENGRNMVRTITGFGARVVQHEYDHLHGVLFIDKLYSDIA